MSVFAKSLLHRASPLGRCVLGRRYAPFHAQPPTAGHYHGRHIATSAGSLDLLAISSLDFTRVNTRSISPRDLFSFVNSPPPSNYNVGAIAIANTTTAAPISIVESMVDGIQSLLCDLSTWFIKRTFQPSIVRKRRKHGFLRRQETVGGRRVLKRRRAKGRMRLGGS